MSELILSTQSNLTDTDQKLLDQYSGQVQQVVDGHIPAKDVYANLYVMIKSLKELKSEITEKGIDELERYGRDDSVERNGFRMKVFSRTDYDYKSDEVWQSLNESRKARENAMKKAASMNRKGQEFFDPQSGEMIPPAKAEISKYIRMEKI